MLLAPRLARERDAVNLGQGFPDDPGPADVRAKAAEAAAYTVHGITNSEGAEAGYGRSEVVLVTSAGFVALREQALEALE